VSCQPKADDSPQFSSSFLRCWLSPSERYPADRRTGCRRVSGSRSVSWTVNSGTRGIEAKLDALEQNRVVNGDCTVDTGSGLPEKMAVGREQFQFLAVFLDKRVDIVKGLEESHRLACGDLRRAPGLAPGGPDGEIGDAFAIVSEANSDRAAFLVGAICAFGRGRRPRRIVPTSAAASRQSTTAAPGSG
jgi:hypothetical protein